MKFLFTKFSDLQLTGHDIVQKLKFFIKDFFGKCTFTEESLMENFNFCAVCREWFDVFSQTVRKSFNFF